MITITESAKNQIEKIITLDEPNLRIGIEGGGCTGFQYVFVLEKIPNDDDIILPVGKANLFIDPISANYLENAVIDYKSDVFNSKFTISNPKVVSTCGCGNSFAF